MSEEKSYEDVALDAWDSAHPRAGFHARIKLIANTIIAEYQRRNSEPVAWRWKDDERDTLGAWHYGSTKPPFTAEPLYAAPQLPSFEPPIHDVEEDTIDRLFNGVGTEGDQMVAARALTTFNPIGSQVSIDVSKGEHDAYDRIFAKIIDWQEDNKEGIYLAVEESRNFTDAAPQLPSVEEIADTLERIDKGMMTDYLAQATAVYELLKSKSK